MILRLLIRKKNPFWNKLIFQALAFSVIGHALFFALFNIQAVQQDPLIFLKPISVEVVIKPKEIVHLATEPAFKIEFVRSPPTSFIPYQPIIKPFYQDNEFDLIDNTLEEDIVFDD